MNFTLQVAGKTDVGCVRKNNEDSFGYDTEHGIFVVCDGMGGVAAGEVASMIGVTTVLSYFRHAPENGEFPKYGRAFEGVSRDANALGSAIQMANHAIRQSGMSDLRHAGMGSTIVAAFVGKDSVSIAHVGDSRIYLVRDNTIQQLTNDHSLVMEQVRRGLITAEEAEGSDLQNLIVRALGPDEEVKPDLADLDIHPDDTLLFCSDGLTRHVVDDQILATIVTASSVDQACDGLIEAAKAGGGTDNITCVLVRFVSQPWYRKLFSPETPKVQES